jgi:ribonuclease HI
MELKIFTDGGAIGNPGPAACAYVIFQNKKPITKQSKHLGHGTNNFAEYQAVILALERVLDLFKKGIINSSKVNFFSDSLLLVSQLNGLYKVKNSAIRDNIMRIRVLEQDLNIPVSYTHIPREENKLADSLVKKELGFSAGFE